MIPRAGPNAEALDPPDWRAAIRPLAPALAGQPVSEASARLLAANGRWRAAEAAYRELIAREPLNVGALRGYALVLRQAGRGDECARMRRRALEAEAARLGLAGREREEAARFLFAAEGGDEVPAAAPAAYVARAFDLYEDYDEHLVERLGYRGHLIVRDAAVRALSPAPRSLRVLDLGCGTGLAGAELRPLARELHGVDLSPRMVERAAARGVYDRLDVGEIVAAMRGRPAAYDLLVASDVLVYVGDLAPVLAAARAAAAPGGAFAFTVERGRDPAGFALGGARRFAHGEQYIADVAQAAGWRAVGIERCVARREHGEAVESLVATARHHA